MLSKEEMYKFVCEIEGPYDNILNQFNECNEIKELLEDNEDIDKYDLSLMMPKVTYDDWIICLYLKDNKLYCVSDVDIAEIAPVEILMYNENFEAINDDGKILDDDEIMEYYNDYDYAGEADDMKSYMFFQQ